MLINSISFTYNKEPLFNVNFYGDENTIKIKIRDLSDSKEYDIGSIVYLKGESEKLLDTHKHQDGHHNIKFRLKFVPYAVVRTVCDFIEQLANKIITLGGENYFYLMIHEVTSISDNKSSVLFKNGKTETFDIDIKVIEDFLNSRGVKIDRN